ncbi:hypothetical protein Slin15195_G112030 [Septoria linicola]|uniref:Uncharacterized protein n=1 Tax=Septoria linicola TaxID=215465 RepID=A0A9Q9EPN8_9PEZI|nr:hypothetical protein Slin15195_G112030 [Septoria linicola]
MFATRNQDENAINTHQQAAAAKPLNASVRGLAPKTPANKAAFKTPAQGNKNDENSKRDFGKTGGGKEGKVDRNAFITPANNRVRAPLGNKTTNAKALQTPALQVPEEDKAKATSPRLRRSKIKVHESLDTAHDVLNTDPEEREIEYMPPREVPLNNDPDDILPYPMNMDVLKGKNLTRGWWSEYSGKVDNDEDSELSDFEEKMKKAKKEEEKRMKPASSSRTGTQVPLKAAPTTMRAQKAASALSSRPTTKPAVPSFAAPTAMTRARLAGSTVPAGRKPAPAAGNPRFAAAKAASNSTIGYSKGRSVSASTRPPLSSIHARPPPVKKEEPKPSTLDNLLKLGAMDIEDEDDADVGLPAPSAALDALLGDDEEEVFQLDPIEDL